MKATLVDRRPASDSRCDADLIAPVRDDPLPRALCDAFRTPL